MKKLLLACVILISYNSFAQGRIDGFYKAKGNGTAVFGLGFEDTKNYFAGNNRTDISRSLYYVSLYGAYGLTSDLNIDLALPFISSNDNNNLQDISVMLKYRFFKSSTQSGRLEFSSAAGFSTNVSNYEVSGLNAIGQQATIIETRMVGHYRWNTGWFLTVQSGFSFKFNETPNSLPATLQVGKATSDWYYNLYYDFQHSFGGIDYLGTPRPQNFKEFGVDFQKIGGTVYRPFSSSWGVYLSLSYVLTGRNVFQGPGYGLGVVYNFGKN